MSNTILDYCQQRDRFAAANGIELLEVAPGRAKSCLKITDRQLNSIDTVHGGALFTLAATTFFAACNATGQMAMGTNMSITCLKAVKSGLLEAEAIEISRSRKLAHADVRITNENGELVALFHGTAYVKGAPYPPK